MCNGKYKIITSMVFVPFLGDLLSIDDASVDTETGEVVFVPFLGDFLSIVARAVYNRDCEISFRPLSWGLSFNGVKPTWLIAFVCFRPLSWGLSFNRLS